MGDRQSLYCHLRSSRDQQERQKCVQLTLTYDLPEGSSLSIGTGLSKGRFDIFSSFGSSTLTL